MKTVQDDLSFPPANAVLEFLSGINYNEHFRNFLAATQVALVWVAAVVFVVWQRFSLWWNESGKDLAVKVAENTYLWVSERAVNRPNRAVLPLELSAKV